MIHKLARILSHVNWGQKFVVPAVIDTSKEKTINIFGKKLIVSSAKQCSGEKNSIGVSKWERPMQNSDASNPLMSFFAGWYILLMMIMFLLS